MSITLKNITAADTISSMVDKINFNFDQLLINGGGIEGPRGVEGYPGMQGKQGERGSTGPEGKQGARGVHFHILSIDDVEYARTWGLTEYDPYGDEYQDGDMIIAYRSESSDSTEYNYTDSIWRVEYQEDGPQGQKCYPVPAINEVGSSSTKNLSFAMTTFFTEFGISGQSSETPNKLLRTKKEDYKRGLVLNDYNENLDASNISQDIIDSIVNNNISLVYTEPLGQNDEEGSPNCGIVFYKNITNVSSTTQIGDYPRINYVYSPDGTINYFNICAKEQGITLFAKNNININSNEGCLILNATSKSGSINVQRNGIDFIVLKSTDPLDEYSPAELHLGADEIYIEKKSDDNNSAISLVSFKNESYIGHSDVCEIKLYKNENYIKLNDDNIFTIGKSGLEFRDSNDIDDDTYFNQSRITIVNEADNSHIELITPELYVGRDPNIKADTNYGMYLSKEKASVIATKINEDESEYPDIVSIDLNADVLHENNITLRTEYPGVVNIANVSEVYASSIINYPHSSVKSRGLYDTVKFCTSPMSDTLQKNGRYNYANMNCYYNMAIRHSKNMGAVHAGTIVFNGNYGTSSTLYDKLTYNFIRIGSTVHCKVSGTINLNKICYRKNSTPNIEIKEFAHIGEKYCKSNDNVYADWPLNTSSYQKFPSSAKDTALSSTPKFYTKSGVSSAADFIASSLLKISLNKLYLNLFPPVVRIEYDPTNDRYVANVTDFIGHLTYTSAGNTYEKQLEYYNDLLIPTGTENNRCYKIRAIAIRDMENSSSSDINSSYNWDGLNQGNSALVLNGTTSQNIIEINAEFSYRIRTEYDDLFQISNSAKSVGTTTVIPSNSFSYNKLVEDVNSPSQEYAEYGDIDGISDVDVNL